MKEPVSIIARQPRRGKEQGPGVAVLKRCRDGEETLLHLLAADRRFMGQILGPSAARWQDVALPTACQAAIIAALAAALPASPVLLSLPAKKGSALAARITALHGSLLIVELQPEREEAPSAMGTDDAGLFGLAPVGLLVVDHNGKVSLANPEAERIFRCPAGALAEKRFEQLVPGSLARDPKDGAAVPGGSGRVPCAGHELQGRRADGSTVPVEVAFTPYSHNCEQAWLAAVTEVGQPDCESCPAYRDETRYRAILDDAVEAYIAMDARGTVVDWNRAAALMFGYPAADAIGRPLTELIIPERFRAAHLAGVARYLENGTTRAVNRRMEVTAQRSDGSEFPVDLSTSALKTNQGVLFQAFVHDLTERKRLEQQIETLLHAHIGEDPRDEGKAEVETNYQRLLNNMIEGVQVLSPGLRYLYMNDSAVAQSRFARGQLIGRTMPELYPGVERTRLYQFLQECLAQRAPKRFVNEFHFPDGKVGFFELSIEPMPEGLLVLSTDITERRNAELAVAEKQRLLEQQNAELERFAQVASHDLQEPLRMVTSYLQLLQRRYGDQLNHEAREFMDFAIDGAHRLKRLINDLLTYSKADRPLPSERIALADVVDAAKRSLASLIEESGAVIATDGLQLEVHAPWTVMKLIMTNLVSNAINFKHPARVPMVTVSGTERGKDLIITVADNGRGIAPEFGDRVFRPFTRYTDKERIPTTGIGLSIVRKHVTRLGGRIWYNSEPGSGSTFYVQLPAPSES